MADKRDAVTIVNFLLYCMSVRKNYCRICFLVENTAKATRDARGAIMLPNGNSGMTKCVEIAYCAGF